MENTKFATMISEIEKMSVLDLHELVKALEEKFDVKAGAMAVAGPAAGASRQDRCAAAAGRSRCAVEPAGPGGQGGTLDRCPVLHLA